MPYARTHWEDRPSTATPVSAENLNNIEDGVEDAHSQIAQFQERLERQALRPPVGGYVVPDGLMTSTTANVTAGRLGLLAVTIDREMTFSHVAFRISTNAAGTGTPSLRFAVYPTNADGSAPDLTQRLAYTPTGDNLKSGTNRELAFASPVTLAPGIYWTAALYTLSGSLTTAPTLHQVDQIASGVSESGTLWFAGGFPVRGWKSSADTHTDLPTSAAAVVQTRDQIITTFLKRSA